MEDDKSSNLKYQTSNYLIVLFITLASSTIGCARYEYEILRPPDFTRHVGSKTDEVFPRDPLEYRLVTVDNHLVMRIFNNSEDPIALLGQRSFAVDPNSQSHPLHTQTIAPHSFIKLIFPPLRPHLEHTGPSLILGVGGYYGSARPYRSDYGFDDPYCAAYDEPRYFAVYDEDNSYYWDWKGEGQMRLMLLFERNDKTFEQEFAIARKKM